MGLSFIRTRAARCAWTCMYKPMEKMCSDITARNIAQVTDMNGLPLDFTLGAKLVKNTGRTRIHTHTHTQGHMTHTDRARAHTCVFVRAHTHDRLQLIHCYRSCGVSWPRTAYSPSGDHCRSKTRGMTSQQSTWFHCIHVIVDSSLSH